MYMGISLLLKILIFFLVVLFIYSPEILPRCDCCGKIKPRRHFEFHIRVNMSLTRKGNLSLCKKCCLKEGFTSVAKYRHYKEVKNKADQLAGWNL